MASALRQVLMHSESVGSQLLIQDKVSSTHTSLQTWLSSRSLEKCINFVLLLGYSYRLLILQATKAVWLYLRTIRINSLVGLAWKGHAEYKLNGESHFGTFSIFVSVLFVKQPLRSHTRHAFFEISLRKWKKLLERNLSSTIQNIGIRRTCRNIFLLG